MAVVDDSSAVRRAQAGDREAFGELVSRHTRGMLAIARAYFASEADAEDAVQDAFIKAFEALGQLESPSRFAAWLARITAHTCIDTLRSRSDKVSLADFSTSVLLLPRPGRQYDTPSTLASRAERAELLKAAIGSLPENQRVAIMLRFGAQMSYEQIASYLDVPFTTVVGRLHRAKRALKEMLKTVETPTP